MPIKLAVGRLIKLRTTVKWRKWGGIPSVFSKNSRTASGWPRSTFTIFINWVFSWFLEVPNCVHPKSDSIVEHVAGCRRLRGGRGDPTGQPCRAGQRRASPCDRASGDPSFFGRRVMFNRQGRPRPPLSKKLHSLPSSIREIIQPRGWRVLSFSAGGDGGRRSPAHLVY